MADGAGNNAEAQFDKALNSGYLKLIKNRYDMSYFPGAFRGQVVKAKDRNKFRTYKEAIEYTIDNLTL